jgi:hypothetical protein
MREEKQLPEPIDEIILLDGEDIEDKEIKNDWMSYEIFLLSKGKRIARIFGSHDLGADIEILK